MGKSKKRAFSLEKNDNSIPKNMSRGEALDFVLKNIDDKQKVSQLISLFGFSAEDLLDYGIDYEKVVGLKGVIND